MKTNSLKPKASNVYVGASFFCLGIGSVGFLVGLWNAALLMSEKGYYAMCFVLAMYSGVTVQKNIRDNQDIETEGTVQ